MWLRAILLVGAVAVGRAPAGQGDACSSVKRCPAGLACVETGAGRACEIRCTANAQCPDDQRCVKDGAARVCRHIDDVIGL
jgi:hypothetical protein